MRHEGQGGLPCLSCNLQHPLCIQPFPKVGVLKWTVFHPICLPGHVDSCLHKYWSLLFFVWKMGLCDKNVIFRNKINFFTDLFFIQKQMPSCPLLSLAQQAQELIETVHCRGNSCTPARCPGYTGHCAGRRSTKVGIFVLSGNEWNSGTAFFCMKNR